MAVVAISAVQGAFAEHASRLRELGCDVIELRQGADAARDFDALVLPGGESTVQTKLLRELGMFETLRRRIAEGMPVLGTCAGLILLADCVEGSGPAIDGFATMPVTVRRNAYGRQLGSFHALGRWTPSPDANVDSAGGSSAECGHDGDAKSPARLTVENVPVPLTFIRAPRIESTSDAVETLVEYDGTPVAVRYRAMIGCAFHPELDDDERIYRCFLDSIPPKPER